MNTNKFAARYIYRMDDICPEMDWGRFWKFIELFQKKSVVPLLGIVPDNKDKDLVVSKEKHDFWEVIKQLLDEKLVEIAQHGYQHLAYSNVKGILSKKYGLSEKTEFVGLPYSDQSERIKKGKNILANNGLQTKVWMAPFHSYDETTLNVLESMGFDMVTDGIGVYPIRTGSLIMVPQQLWQPRIMPIGLWTVCLHTNGLGVDMLEKIEKHIIKNSIIKFSEADAFVTGYFGRIINNGFSLSWKQIMRYKMSRN